MMNLPGLVLVFYTALCGLYKTAYAILLTKPYLFHTYFCLYFMLHYEVSIEQFVRYFNQNSIMISHSGAHAYYDVLYSLCGNFTETA